MLRGHRPELLHIEASLLRACVAGGEPERDAAAAAAASGRRRGRSARRSKSSAIAAALCRTRPPRRARAAEPGPAACPEPRVRVAAAFAGALLRVVGVVVRRVEGVCAVLVHLDAVVHPSTVGVRVRGVRAGVRLVFIL